MRLEYIAIIISGVKNKRYVEEMRLNARHLRY